MRSAACRSEACKSEACRSQAGRSQACRLIGYFISIIGITEITIRITRDPVAIHIYEHSYNITTSFYGWRGLDSKSGVQIV